VLSGPTFAHEVAAGLPTAVTLACSGGEAQWRRLAPLIARPALRPYYSDDIVGAEIGKYDLTGILARFEAHGVGAAPVYDIAQLLADPHVRFRGMVVDVPDRAVRFPIAIPRTGVANDPREHVGSTEYAIVNPGAAWPNKRWPPDRFGAVAAALQRDSGLRSIVLWGPGEESLAAAVVAASQGAAAAAPPTHIADLVALTRDARVMISGDTGPLHIAGSMGTPLVALFGPTYPERNGPWSPRDVVISRVSSCACHYERRCRRAEPCINDITVDEVLDGVRRVLAVHG